MPFILFFYTMSFPLFLSTSHWFIVWCSLELNTIMMVGLIMSKKAEKEAALVYFLTQSISSMIIIFLVCYLNNSMMVNPMIMPMMVMVIAYKLAMAPFFSWFVGITLSMPTFIFFLMLTMQKILPFCFMFSNNIMTCWEVFIMTTLSLLMGSVMNMSQSKMKTILSLSSISHLGWFILAILLDLKVWLMYFTMYVFLMFMLIQNMESNSKQASTQGKQHKIMMMFLLLTLMGLPPLFMFMPKLAVMSSILNHELWMYMVSILISSMIDFFVYTRISYSIYLMMGLNHLWCKKMNYNSLLLSSTYMLMWMICCVI